LSARHLKEMMAEHGVAADDATIHGCTLKILPVLAGCFGGASVRSDQAGHWNYLCGAVQRITRLMLGIRAFRSAARIIAGIETMYMIKKGQLHCPRGQRLSAGEQFYGLAF
jgi:transposase-like protein